VIASAPEDKAEATDVDALLRAALDRLSVKEAVAEVAAVTGEPRRDVYQRALALAKKRDEERDHGR
jgi:16S rRNA (cytidine1402-2'-O)-methyltransferase